METPINTSETGRILQPEFTPKEIISDREIAKSIIKEVNPQTAHPSSPKVNVNKWKPIIEFFSPELFTYIAEESSFNDRRKCFTTLSLRFDENTPFEVDDLIDIDVGPTAGNKEKDYREHILNAYEYALNILPPVTATLVGGWLGQVRIFDNKYYKKEILPNDKKWGGMNYPYRKEIQIGKSCWNNFHLEYPSPSHSQSCIMLHEIGHIVHNIYGFYRPGDTGYNYPSKKYEQDSTGCLHPFNLSSYQAEFVYEMVRSYALHHMDEFEDVDYSGYGRTHPAEAFACGFELLLRKGEQELFDNYEQFVDVMSLME